MEKDNSKEINLLQLFTLLFNWISKQLKHFINFFGYLFRVSYRNYRISVIVIFIFLGIGLFLSRPDARIYKAEAMAMIYGSEAQTVKEISKQLENSISSNNLYSLSAKLSIPDSVAKNIVCFESFYVIDYLKDNIPDKVDFENNHPLTDTQNVRMRDRLYFRILTKNIAQTSIVQAAVLNYFNSNPLMKAQFSNRKSELAQEIAICNKESQRIDSLAKISYFKDTNKQLKLENNTLVVGEQKKQLFFNDLLELQTIRAKAEARYIDFKQPMELQTGFVVMPHPVNGVFRYGLISLLIGYFVSLIVCILIENMKGIKKYLDNK
jgi:hypothetical protein